MFTTHLHGSKRYSEDEFALRIDSSARRSFANRQLFKSGASLHPEDFEASEDYSPNEYSAGCDFEVNYSHESSLNPSMNDSAAFNMSPAIRRGVSMMPPVMENFSQEELSDNFDEYYEDDETDLFFCCADWESQVKQVEQEDEDLWTPASKRQNKMLDKLQHTEHIKQESIPEFDVDLVMQMNYSNSCGKLLGKRKFIQKSK